ncbi:bifunctional phosphopantothenoylcysteine decarboxylase/phosphopantothenate--cysteine ligase CoaBC [Leucobacter sp. UT-8R-CII-1-4]|uniref:bifunctional phosphopantothenoylcysteine decarboxylase/phosphopantothenate--cysteine ligase CoaBC n=1 Tax=Leucobacter sp. UT-8R-CII-1-4 TaxID=3040075 RepID=UPI0024A7FC20|nr:bifunctional phosphopantothenoylcysteine decarboxylase/phosphopantothenate--cysteine ligase CoaBC [Leucobacter sp. UT-8R-CII-1-4]MDI6022144.1 bifunctional phosphopantothenoylcysteine decarboxylase/phosphopantothenate--cysteine ligase CoaBC [Leucobacter sp. UT-8R-CII-1-4]
MNIVLGVSGGIAAYKAVSLARLFVESGHELHVVPTADALRFVGLPTWEAISRNPVTTSVHDNVPEVRHVGLGQRADLIVIAPATANTLAKMTAGLADDLLGTTLLASTAPVLVAPAMHTEMWQHAATQHNVQTLRNRGVHFVGPDIGRLTGNDSGPGRMSEPETIFAAANSLLDSLPSQQETLDHPTADLAGLRVLVSAGGTREPLDPVRFLGNRSSGKQGVAIAAAAAARGAEVTLVAANIDDSILATAGTIRVLPVGTTADLDKAMRAESAQADVVIMAAAVADYRAAEIADGKIRKEETNDSTLTLTLVENPDVLRGLVSARKPGQLIVGFAAETVQNDDELLERGRRKLARKGCDLLALNAVGWGEGFESDHNELLILGSDGAVLQAARGSKTQTAHALLNAISTTRAGRVS